MSVRTPQNRRQADRGATAAGGHPRLAAGPPRRRLPGGHRAPGARPLLDVGCGQGFESVGFVGPGRRVVGVDYSAEATGTARARFGPDGLAVAQMDALALGLGDGSFDWVCSSHLIEHFERARGARGRDGPGAGRRRRRLLPHPERAGGLREPLPRPPLRPTELVERARAVTSTRSGWAASTPSARVKADFAARRAKAERLLKLDVLDLRHRIPRRWYVAAYTRLLPLAYRLVARGDTGGTTGHHRRRLVRDRGDRRHHAGAVRRRPAAPAEPRLSAGRRAHRGDRLGQVGRGRPAGRPGRRPDRRRPGGP